MCGTRNAPSKRSCEQPGGSSSHMPSEVDIGGSVPTWGVFDSLWIAMDAVLACARQRAALTRCCEVHPCGAVRGDVGRISWDPSNPHPQLTPKSHPFHKITTIASHETEPFIDETQGIVNINIHHLVPLKKGHLALLWALGKGGRGWRKNAAIAASGRSCRAVFGGHFFTSSIFDQSR